MALGRIASPALARGAVGPSLDVAVEHCVRTRHLFRRIAEAAEEGEGEEKSDGDARTFGRCADMTQAILASGQTETDQQTTRKHRRGVDDKADSKKTWCAPPGTALDEPMLHLHLGGVACTGRLTSYKPLGFVVVSGARHNFSNLVRREYGRTGSIFARMRRSYILV